MQPIELLMVGDVNCKLDGPLSEKPLAQVESVLNAADVRIGNLEGAFGDPTVMLDYKEGWYHCEPEGFKLIDGFFDAFGCANNVHHGDAIRSSSELLDRAGVGHTGAGANLAAARVPAIVERKGTKVGLLAYTAIFWPYGHAASEDAPGVAAMHVDTAYQPHPRLIEMPGAPATTRSWPTPEDVEMVRSDIAALRPEVDVLVVYMHWGVSSNDQIAEYQQRLGHAMIDAGADIVTGSHPHVPQGIEFYGTGAILYSLGNFMFGWKLRQHRTRDGLLARVEVKPGAAWELSVVPVRRDDAGDVVILDRDSDDGRRIVDRVTTLCEGFGTRLEQAGDRFIASPEGTSVFGVRA